MAKWEFEPGHTAAEFAVRHMMATLVRGSFKNVKGSLAFDIGSLELNGMNVEIDATNFWTGEENRDKHLKSADFLDVENHPKITFNSKKVKRIGAENYLVVGELSIRGITKEVELKVRYLGVWDTPFWVGKEDKGPKKRAGFLLKGKINRHDFKVSWNNKMDKGGVVVGDEVYITADVEALLID
jgi:polyisoprenoid-binding protein YceI